MDGSGTSCHDDALSIKNIDKIFKVGIHISDVDEFVPVGSFLDTEARKKDKTMYVKGFYNPMFYTPLMKFLSLSSDNNKLAYSLYF